MLGKYKEGEDKQMIGYLYHITNLINNKTYIGKTNNIDRRISRHFSDLKKGQHHSHKLQRAFNKYGEKVFKVTYETFLDISEKELADKEISEIKKFNSYYNGYNETLGGEGHALLFDFEEQVLIYQIGQRYDGIKHKLANYFKCDRTTLTAIMKKDVLSHIQYSEEKLQTLIQQVGITKDYLKENYKNNYTKKLNKFQVFCILAEIEFNNISQATCGRACGVTKDLVQNIVSGRTYKKEYQAYIQMDQEKKKKYLNQLPIDRTAKKMSKVQITQALVDYILDNKGKKTQTEIAKELNIDRKRVSRIINKETYLNFIKDWEKRHLHS